MFEKTFQELKIGPVTVRNRLYMCPMGTSQAEQVPGDIGTYLPSERQAYYYAERAKGGFGLIYQEAGPVHRSSDPAPMYMPMLSDERSVPGLTRIVDEVHKFGAKIFLQMWHISFHGGGFRTRLPLYSPSQVPNLESGTVPKEMEIEDIRDVQDGFVKAALNARRAGYDGVEFHCSHSYLPNLFLSPAFNRRTDEYGGSLENRMRFVLEIIDRVREAIGPDMALGIRLLTDEMVPGGYNLEDCKEMCRRFEATGKLDFIDLDLGNYHTAPLMISPLYIPAGYATEYIAAIKGVVKTIPVTGTPGGFSDPAEIEKVLAEGKMDMVGLGRASIADPQLPNKMREGRVDEIRKCIRCMEECTGRIFRPAPVSCAINPAAGNEKQWGVGTFTQAEKRKRVVVAGAGPAGLEASRVLSLRGHEVLLYEKEDLGGYLKSYASMPGREHYEGVIRWYQNQLEKNNVSVSLGKEVTPELIQELKPDAVVVATGSRYRRDGFSGMSLTPIPGWERENVVTPEEVITKKATVGRKVVIVDDEGWDMGLLLADLLADGTRDVTIVTRGNTAGANVAHLLMVTMMLVVRNTSKGVKFNTSTAVSGIKGKVVTTRNIYTQVEKRIRDVDTVVLVTARESDDKLYKELKGKVAELYRIGDCVAPRRIGDATHDGHLIGRLI